MFVISLNAKSVGLRRTCKTVTKIRTCDANAHVDARPRMLKTGRTDERNPWHAVAIGRCSNGQEQAAAGPFKGPLEPCPAGRFRQNAECQQGPLLQAARTDSRNLATSIFSRLLSLDSNCAAER